jgi:hypothetical protein
MLSQETIVTYHLRCEAQDDEAYIPEACALRMIPQNAHSCSAHGTCMLPGSARGPEHVSLDPRTY